MTELLYRDDPYLLEFDAGVVEARTYEGRPAVVLDRTAFYAESGGQPFDLGTLDGVPVTAVLHQGDDVLHVLERPLSATRVHGRVDADRRRDHRQQHHGQHLLSRAFVEVGGARTVAFHLGAAVSTIDLDRGAGASTVERAERRANEVVWEGRPVRVRTVSRAEAERLGVAVPEEAGDAVRLVDAEGFDLQPCGGTHPRSTAEVGVIVVLGHERHKGGTRVRFVCGHRALDEVRRRNATLDRVGATLSVAPEALADAVERLSADKVAAERRSRDLLERALAGDAARLLAETPPGPGGARVVVRTLDGWPADDLRTLARQLTAATGVLALLGAHTAGKAHVVFARSEGLALDVGALLRPALEALGGRGGGRGTMAQGGGDRPDRLGEALETAAATARRELGG
ncbi:MAG TPA: DHHA1 domain-containing protein [Vicinamibacteria bacterium]|nr:DHHA1 domain-containing protein [Vicinamibacteria bacterium]